MGSSFYSDSGLTSTEQDSIESAIAAAETAQSGAETAKAAAETAEANAETAEANAETAQAAAETAETNAAASATAAASSATSAASSLAAIGNSEANAATSATNAATSATNASNSASSASTAQTAAETAKTAAETAETNAETAEANAASSATSAATSATNSSNSATAAATSATNASSSATSASTSATTATTKASEASTSATNASTSASNASTSETNAASSATAAAASAASAASSVSSIGTSVSDAASSATSAAASLSSFQNQYLGASSTAPTQDPDGSALDLGDLYFDTTANVMKVYSSSGWTNASSSVNGTSERQTYTATSGQTTFSVTYDAGFVDVWLNGAKLLSGTDFTATSGTDIVLASGAAAGDIVDILAFGTFVFTSNDHYTKTASDARYEPIDTAYTKAESDARYVELSGDTMTGNLDVTGTVTADGLTVDKASGSLIDLNATASGTPTNYITYSDTGGATAYVGFDSSSNNNFAIYNATATGDITLRTNSLQRLNIDGATGDISFYEDTGTTAKFFWDASEEALGIGTTPSNTIHVEKSVSGDWLGRFRNTHATNGYGLLVYAGDDSSVQSFKVANHAGSGDYLVVRGDGHVGIGEGSPNADLVVKQSGSNFTPSGNTVALFQRNTATGSGCMVSILSGNNSAADLNFADAQDEDVGRIRYNHSDNSMQFQTNASEVMRLTSAGDVKIGTDSDRTSYLTQSSANLQIGGGLVFEAGSGNNAEILNYRSTAMVFGNSATEDMRIDNGNLLVGKTSPNGSVLGSELRASGKVVGCADGTDPLYLNRKTSDGDIAVFAKDGTTVGSIGCNSGNHLFIGKDDTGIVFQANETVAPYNPATNAIRDNAIDLGNSSNRFDDVFATNGTIQTSDQNEKQQIASLTDAEMTAAKAISKLFKTFKWNDSVAEKGDAARTHTGVIAQQVETAMSDAGLDAGDYAFFISTTWWETQTEVPAVEAVDEVLDEDGNVITEAVEGKEAYTRTDTYETAEEAPEGATERNRKGIRYPQLLSFIGAATEQRLASIETRLDALEAN